MFIIANANERERSTHLYEVESLAVLNENHCYTVQTFSITKNAEQNRTELLNCADRRSGSENDSLLMERKLYHCLKYFPYLRIIFLLLLLFRFDTQTHNFSSNTNFHFISFCYAHKRSHTHSLYYYFSVNAEHFFY